MGTRRPYPSDLTNAQWALLAPLLMRPRRADGRGRPPTVALREVVNAILYVLREGCRWRALPHDFPPWQTVYWYFAKWSDDGTLVQIHDALRRRTREQLGRDPDPSALIIDSQSVKATEKDVPSHPQASRGGGER
jgi:transposase